MDFVSPILDVVKCIMVPTCRYVEHHRILGERMEVLRAKVEELNCKKEDIERRKQTEERSDNEVAKGVVNWLKRVDKFIEEIQTVEEKFQKVSFLCRSCLSKRVQKKIVEVDKILEKEFPSIVIDMPSARGLILPTDPNANEEGDQNRVKFRQNLEEKIMGYLMGDDVAIVGVCGQGGVGKTTLAKSINNKVSNLEDSKFDKVIWAPIPYPFSVVKLQDNIAVAMNENLPEGGNEEGQAAKLFEIMGKVKFLLILDDAWDEFTFHNVGIPIPKTENGCNVVITSRSTQLCKQIGCNDDGLVDVETLSEESSYNLFLDTVGRDVISKTQDVEGTLRDLVKECAGLPLAIVVIGRSMRGENNISGWRNALNDLKNCVESVNGWEKKIFERLKFSYDRLNNEELQNCFLFCSLYGKSWEILKEVMMECWIEGGLIKRVKTRKAMVDRARDILNRLISDCLIEEAGKDCRGVRVRMHDVMRDMALRVAGSRFLVKAGEEVRCITENGEWTDHLEKVSMIDSGMSEISLDFCPNCPKLSALLLARNHDLRMIPESFFEGMPSLEYLILSNTSISALPSSIYDLKNLTTLLLCGIKELKYVPSLAGLKALKKLDMFRAGIEVVPEGIEALVNLQYLDLLCPNLVEFPIRILKDLSRLETLAANFSSCWLDTDFVIEAKKIPARLNMLETFIGHFDNLEGLSNYVKFFHQLQKPTRYIITVGGICILRSCGYSSLRETIESSMRVVIWRLDIQEKHGILLPNDLQQLEIYACRGVGSLSETSLSGMETDLRSCRINGGSFEYILDLGSPSSVCRLFDKCEVLYLSNMDELRALVKWDPQAASAASTSHASLSSPPSIFSNIKTFEIDSRVMWDVLEWVNPATKEILLPFFKPHSDARSLYWEFDVLQDFNNFVNRFRGDNLTSYQFIVKPKDDDDDDHSGSKSSGDKDDDDEVDSGSKSSGDKDDDDEEDSGSKSSGDKDDDDEEDSGNKSSDDKDDDEEEDSGSKSSDDKDDYDVDESFYYEDIVEIERDSLKIVALHGVQINVDQAVLLPNDVQFLEIKKCGGMKSLCGLKSEAMNLTSCVVKQCGELECMLPSSSTCSLLDNGLQSLMLSKLPKLQVLVRMENQAIPTPPSIFSNLKHFVVFHCPRIKKLFPSELLKCLPNLEKIIVVDCAEMEEIIIEVGGEEGEKETITFTLPNLKELVLYKLPKLKRICGARGVMVCDSIEEIKIGKCEMLKRIPLYLPLLPDGQLSPPPLLKNIEIDSSEWWESLEWDKPTAKDILNPFLRYVNPFLRYVWVRPFF